jgi:hypothetical protein
MAFATTKETTTSLTFPHPDLAIIIGKPTYATVRKLQKELYANSQAIPSTLGGGQNGHLALVMTDAEYLIISAETYDKPVHPGTQPAHQGGATSAQMTEANRLHDGKITQVSLHVSVINTKELETALPFFDRIFIVESRTTVREAYYRKLTKMLSSGIELWKFYFQIRACCALTSAFNKIAGKNCRQTLFFRQTIFCRKLTERLVSGIKLWKIYFQIRACCALTSAFNKTAGTKKNCRKTLFLAVKCFFCRQTLFLAGNALH